MELDCPDRAPGTVASVEPVLKNTRVGPGSNVPVDQGNIPGVPAPVGLPVNADDADMRQKVLRVQAEAQLPRLVSGPKQKDNILEKYQAQYGNGKSIVTSLEGEHLKLNLQPPSQYHLMESCRTKPDKNKSYSVKDPTISNVIVSLVETYLSKTEISRLSMVNKLFAEVIPEIKRLFKLDWRPIIEARPNYNAQKYISMDRVDMATALALRCGLDP